MSEGKRILLALGLSIGVIAIWQTYFPQAQQPAVQVKQVAQTSSTTVKNSGSIEPSDTNTQVLQTNNGPIEPVNANIKTYKIGNEIANYTVDNTLKFIGVESTYAKFTFDKVYGDHIKPRLLFKLNGETTFQAKTFKLVSQSRTALSFKSKQGIIANYFIDDKGLLQLALSSFIEFDMKFFLNSSEKSLESREVRNFAVVKKAIEKYEVGDEEGDIGAVKWFGVDFNYHLFAVAFPEKVPFKYKAGVNGVFQASTSGLFEGEQVYKQNLTYAYTLKDYDTLSDLGNNLKAAVDFGIWSVLSIPMLKALKFFYSLVQNWGLAIIFLTIVMRLLTFPLQYKSFKSMKKMQILQPKMKELNERYADNPQKKQMETMALMKKEGANPLGGCLPMLLQFPIFIAFYRMLGAAVELVGAPFYFWLTDLSQKDPYYILPVLVTAVFVLQQKLTPSATADPMQKKVMMFMPLIFGFIMKDLPSGLNLYIFASTLLGITMQKLVYKKLDKDLGINKA